MEKYRIDYDGEALTSAQLKAATQELVMRARFMQENYKYFKARNPKILLYGSNESGAGNRVPVSYGRKIVNTVTGYMFAPGRITYSTGTNVALSEMLSDVFYWNNEKTRNLILGRNCSIYGFAAELMYTGVSDNREIPKFRPIASDEVLPIYDANYEDDVVAVLRLYSVVEGERAKPVNYVDIHYPGRVETLRVSTGYDRFEIEEILASEYSGVSINIYENNEEQMGEIEVVKKLIDAYDILASDTINEVEKWSLAYLALVGASLKADDETSLPNKRIIELPTGGSAFFLTKNINPAFLEFARKLIREEIHRQSHIPDMSDEHFSGNQTGIALKYKLMDLENLCITKEAFFRDGLFRRIEMIEEFMGNKYGETGKAREVEINFSRNVPDNPDEGIGSIQKGRGNLSLETLIRTFAKFVKDPKEEIRLLEEEKEAGLGTYGIMEADLTDEDDENEDEET